jgi:hypothetical protein
MSEMKCAIHGLDLQPDRVSISFGLPFVDDELIEARRNLFPNSKRHVHGGCVLGDETNAEVMHCGECRLAEHQWRKDNDRESRVLGDTVI